MGQQSHIYMDAACLQSITECSLRECGSRVLSSDLQWSAWPTDGHRSATVHATCQYCAACHSLHHLTASDGGGFSEIACAWCPHLTGTISACSRKRRESSTQAHAHAQTQMLTATTKAQPCCLRVTLTRVSSMLTVYTKTVCVPFFDSWHLEHSMHPHTWGTLLVLPLSVCQSAHLAPLQQVQDPRSVLPL